MNQKHIIRFLIYIAGLIILAFGLTLNTTTALGVSAIISVAHTGAVIFDMSIGDATLILYSCFVLIEIVIHTLLKKRDPSFKLKRQIIFDLLQLPMSIVFTRLMNAFAALLPMLEETEGFTSTFPFRLLILFVALIATGVGTAMSLDMRLVANPADGGVQAFSDFFKKEVGLMKNITDGVCIVLSLLVSYLVLGRIVSVGIGTVCAVFFIGRVIALFNSFFLVKLKRISGQEVS